MELKGLNLNYNICLFFNFHICWFICHFAEPFAKGTCYGIQCSNISDISKKISKGLTQTSPFVFHCTQGKQFQNLVQNGYTCYCGVLML